MKELTNINQIKTDTNIDIKNGVYGLVRNRFVTYMGMESTHNEWVYLPTVKEQEDFLSEVRNFDNKAALGVFIFKNNKRHNLDGFGGVLINGGEFWVDDIRYSNIEDFHKAKLHYVLNSI